MTPLSQTDAALREFVEAVRAEGEAAEALRVAGGAGYGEFTYANAREARSLAASRFDAAVYVLSQAARSPAEAPVWREVPADASIPCKHCNGPSRTGCCASCVDERGP